MESRKIRRSSINLLLLKLMKMNCLIIMWELILESQIDWRKISIGDLNRLIEIEVILRYRHKKVYRNLTIWRLKIRISQRYHKNLSQLKVTFGREGSVENSSKRGRRDRQELLRYSRTWWFGMRITSSILKNDLSKILNWRQSIIEKILNWYI